MSAYEDFASTADGARRLAASRLRYGLLEELHRALDESGLSQTELAERLGVRKSAVSQVLRGDGNLRANTIAEYLFALDRELDVKAIPAGELRRRALGGDEPVASPASKLEQVRSLALECAADSEGLVLADQEYDDLTSVLRTLLSRASRRTGRGKSAAQGPAAEWSGATEWLLFVTDAPKPAQLKRQSAARRSSTRLAPSAARQFVGMGN